MHVGGLAGDNAGMATKAELERLLAEATARAEAAEARAAAEATVMWSARVPKTLRQRVKALQGEATIQDVTIAALQAWCGEREAQADQAVQSVPAPRGRAVKTAPAKVAEVVASDAPAAKRESAPAAKRENARAAKGADTSWQRGEPLGGQEK